MDRKAKELLFMLLLCLFILALVNYSRVGSYEKYQRKLITIKENNELIRQRDKHLTKLQQMINRDDRILNGLLHDTWDRDCVYERVPGELLADGTIRESLIQHCD